MMKRKAAEKENMEKGQTVKKARKSVVEVLTDQNQQHQRQKSSKLAGPISKVLRSFNVDVSQDFCKLLYHFLPGDQRSKGPEIAAFCFFVQRRHQIFVQKSSMEKTMTREGLFQEKFFTNIYREADTGTKYLRRRILGLYDVRVMKTEEVQDVIFMTVCYR